MRRYSFLYPESISYDFMMQRPQMMMKFLSRRGNTTHFINKNVDLPGAINYSKTVEKEPQHFIHPDGTNVNQMEWDTLYYTYPPPGIDILQKKRPKHIIFDSVDDPTDGVFAFWNIGNAYYKSLAKADLVLATAKNLYDIALEYNDNVLFSPNACDYDFMVTPQNKPLEYLKVSNPIVLYLGALATWVNLELIEKTASQSPEYEFFIVGAPMNDMLTSSLPNMHILGHRHHDTVPSYIQHADVCIIPFREEQPEIKSCSPVKLPEYFACGKPVITTAMPETKGCADVFWSDTEDKFIMNISRAYRSRNKNKEQRQEFARKNSWNQRVLDLLERMEEL